MRQMNAPQALLEEPKILVPLAALLYYPDLRFHAASVL